MFGISSSRPTNAVQYRSLSETDVVTKSEPSIIQTAADQVRNPDSNGMTEFEQTVYETKKYHRLIEKRRRDRINECIFQLKDLLPTDVINSTTRSMEKAVILELVLQYMKSLERKRRQEKKDIDKLQEQAFINGFRECAKKMFELMDDKINEEQQKFIRNQLQEATSFYISESPMQQKIDNIGAEVFLHDSQETNNPIVSSTSMTQEIDETQKAESCPSISSQESTSSSSTSDLSMSAENSDSSGSGSGIQIKPLQKILKRKIFHNRSASVPGQLTMESTTSQSSGDPPEKKPDITVINTQPNNNPIQSQVPVYINMPLVMNPGMVQAPVTVKSSSPVVSTSNTTSATGQMAQTTPVIVANGPGAVVPQIDGTINSSVQQMPAGTMVTTMGGNVTGTVPMQLANGAMIAQMGGNFIQSGMQLPNGTMIPQMAGNVAGGVQYPTFFMACGSQPQTVEQSSTQQVSNQHQPQAMPMNPMIIQPTFMMPMRGQNNVICMPSFPVMQPFQQPALVPVQTPTPENAPPNK